MDAATAAANCQTAAAAPRPARWPWVLLTLWFLLDFGLFYQFLQREVTWSYPPKHDQLHYLYDSYVAHDAILAQGPVAGLRRELRDGWLAKRPQGILLVPIEASLLYLVFGPGRSTALLVNFLHFVALQVALVITLKWATGRWNLALLGLGLLTTAMFPFAAAGGLYDFRLDFASFCLFGIVCCLVLRSGPFQSWRWSLLAGVAASLLIWSRFIVAVYFAGIFGVIVAALCVRWLWRWWRRTDRADLRREFVCLLGCGGVMAGMVLPVLYTHREAIKRYYIVGHVTGPEKSIRAQVDGILTTLDHASFYPKSVLRTHIGWTSGILLGATVLIWTLQSFRGRRRAPGETGPPLQLRTAGRYLLASIIVPIIILSLDEAKSGVVGAIVVTPVILLAMVWVVRCQDRLRERPQIVARTGWGLAAVALLAGLNLHANQFAARTHMSLDRRENLSVVAAAQTMVDYAVAHRESNARYRKPRVVLDGVYDFINHGVLNVVGYERHGALISAVNGGGRIFDVTQEEMLRYAADADFIVVTRSETGATFTYPFDKAMMAIRPHLRAYCEENLEELTQFQKMGRTFTVYVRDCVRFSGDEGGWITPAELTLAVPAATLRRIGAVEIKGRWPQIPWTQSGKATPGVTAWLQLPDRDPEPLPAELKILSGRYELTIRCSPRVTSTDGTIHFRFDDYFVPAELGGSKDTRQLVALSPDEIRVQPLRVSVAGGTKDGWITADGLTLDVPQAYLESRSCVVLSGPWSAPPGVRQPQAIAELELPETEPVLLETEFLVTKDRYTLRIGWEPKERPADGRVSVKFSSHFVPKELGISADPRQFVSRLPDSVQVLR